MSLLIAMLLAASPAQDIKCPSQSGFIDEPVVRDERTARAIFAAVVDQFADGQTFSGYEVIAEDSPDHRTWIVFHYKQPPPGQIQRGGGGIGMKIDKCTGAISELSYQR